MPHYMEKTGSSPAGTVQSSVYLALRKSIINLNLAPGTAISEKEVGSRYNVSRTPVREAFINLSKEGLVKVIPQKETLVSLIDFGRVEQEFFLRESLEMAVLKPFIANYEAGHLAELSQLIAMQNEAFDRNEYIKFLNYDDAFHRILFVVAGQNLSWEVLESMCGHYHRVRLLTTRLRGVGKNIMSQHKNILTALKKKDLDDARARLNLHLHKLDAEEKGLRREFPGYFALDHEHDAFDVDFGGLSLLP
jgi:DNA-binding GntR family transcriptional regulator